MRVTIGRFGLDIDQTNTHTLEQKGDEITLSGRLSAGPGRDVEFLREQINGLAGNPFEAFYPVTFESVPSFDGYYTVTDASTTLGPGSMEVGAYPYSISMKKVGSFASPQLEAALFGKLRVNWYDFATDAPWHAVPDAVPGYGLSGASTTIRDVRSTADGDVRLYSAGHNPYMYDGFAKFTLPPANYYDGSAKIRAGQVDPIASDAFGYTGGSQLYTVPAGVTRVLVECRGGQGGGIAGGKGGRVISALTVTPGENLIVNVGQRPAGRVGGWNGGGNGGLGTVVDDNPGSGFGGGGASDVRQGGTGLANRKVVAGGGGGMAGAATYGFFGGAGAGTAAGDGANTDGSGGKKGTATAGGKAGTSVQSSAVGTAGTLGVGGNGAAHPSLPSRYGGGGGGGGLYGGGGGGGNTSLAVAGSGGGGSSLNTGQNVIRTTGYQSGHGAVFISPITTAPAVDRYTVIGSQTPNTPFGWELSNGIVAVSPTYTAGQAQLDVRCWNGSYWSGPRQWYITDAGASTSPALLDLTAFTVLGNNPDECVIRASYEYGLNADQVTLTLLLRRGSPIIDVTLDSSVSQAWGVRTVATAASTNMTAGNGLNDVTPDVDGNQWCLISPFPTTRVNAGQSGAYEGPATTWRTFPFGVGFRPGGFSQSMAQLCNEWYAFQSVMTKPVLT